MELDVAERLSCPSDRDLGLRGAVGVVERGLGGAPLGDTAQVLDGQRLVESAPGAVKRRLLEPHQRRECARAGRLAIHRPQASMGATAVRGTRTTLAPATEGSSSPCPKKKISSSLVSAKFW